MNAALEPEIQPLHRPLYDTVEAACKRIPPLWPLRNFVAVNPFVGLTRHPFSEAARLIQKTGHGEILMPARYYLDQINSGRIQNADFEAAMAMAEKALPPECSQQIDFASLGALTKALQESQAQPRDRVLTFADFLDVQNGTAWAAFVVEEISKWCSAYYDQGQSSWRMPWRSLDLFAAWRAAARLDVNPELSGLKGFRAFVAGLPEDPRELIDRALGRLKVGEGQRSDFLHRQLMSLAGWSSYVQYLVREKNLRGQSDDSLAQLLAIRLVYDLALLQQSANNAPVWSRWKQHLAGLETAEEGVPPGLLARLVAQLAMELQSQRDWIWNLKTQPPQSPTREQKSLQAIFCIDVRSEVFRRSLEAQSSHIETLGFAGFFGMAIEYLRFGQPSGGAQCPVLLTPKFKVREALRQKSAGSEEALLRRWTFRQTVNSSWNAFKTSAISCFSFVETAGLWFAAKLGRDSLALGAAESAWGGRRYQQFGPQIELETCCIERHGHKLETGIPLSDQVALAAGALKNMGLVSHFARVVLLCGHGSATTNNPYGSALDCGACGGHAGDANARVAAAILNRPAVREGLKQLGIVIPSETLFIAGLHNTTTDEITLFADEPLSATQAAELEKCKPWLSAASRQARRERASSLGLTGVPETALDEKIFERARDWSQVRPEWGLAGNAAFIAAPRERTKGLNLGGRTFLHNYDAQLDADKSTLELILTAPMVVASWINLQYYASTVDNRLFGSGNKVLHNVVGTFGVWQGNGGDLQAGLPLQSIHDGTRLRHEPLRLSVFVEARWEDIDAVLRSHPQVRELVDNSWIHLFSIEPGGTRLWRRLQGFIWEEETGKAPSFECMGAAKNG